MSIKLESGRGFTKKNMMKATKKEQTYTNEYKRKNMALYQMNRQRKKEKKEMLSVHRKIVR